MGLRVNTNITAITAQRNLTLADSQLFRSVQRLSSGLRINTAADDPAGLAISEQLRAQVAGLNAAIVNSERAVDLVQTIEGALITCSRSSKVSVQPGPKLILRRRLSWETEIRRIKGKLPDTTIIFPDRPIRLVCFH
jgi:hypothetical protein